MVLLNYNTINVIKQEKQKQVSSWVMSLQNIKFIPDGGKTRIKQIRLEFHYLHATGCILATQCGTLANNHVSEISFCFLVISA